MRLYANINDRLFGRDKELQELLSKFSDPRGRGVSLAGIGGVGKTELAITLVQQLYDRRQFRRIYSGSAKQTLLGPTGPQSADPVFTDFNSFLRDLAAWLGIDSGGAETARLKEACRSELAKLERVLFFVDNLETIRDRELFDFLESEVPSTVWLVLTGRVHRVRSYVYQKELRELEAHDAAQLLRHELKRQGLVSLADLPIVDIERVAKELYGHPLALRWFAWACKRDPQLWSRGVQRIDREQLEEFCVAHTLNALSREAQKTLGAVLALQGVTDVTTESVAVTAGLPTAAVEQALYDLECSGLVSVYSTDPPGDFVYQLSPLANAPAAGLARKEGWEREYVQNLRTMTRAIAREQPLDPLVSELMVYPLSRIKPLIPAERADLQARVRRSLARCPEDRKYALYALEAECERHAGNPVTADDLYKKSAEQILAQGTVDGDDTKKIRILLEAATVAKARAQSPAQMTRAISYLKAIEHSNIAPQRVLGMLMEFSAILRRKEDYRAYRARAMEYVQAHADERTGGQQLQQLRDAIARADDHMQ